MLTTDKVNIWREIAEAQAGIVHDDTQEGTDRLLNDWLALTPRQKAAMRERTVACFEDNFELKRVTRHLLEALTIAASATVIEPTFRGRLLPPLQTKLQR